MAYTTHHRNQLVEGHAALARQLAHRYTHRGAETDDLVQVAYLALVKAARGYDSSQGDFAPYAAATIRGDLKKYFRDQAWAIRPPRRLQELQAAMAAIDSRTDSAAELAQELDVSREEVTEAEGARGCFTLASLDRPVGQSGDSATFADLLEVRDASLDMVDEWVTFCQMCRGLHVNERELLRLRFVEEETQQEIADRLGISQMQVSRRLRQLLDRLRAQAAA